jgi:protein-S-isoprenylcysteine O-methyltransferase Ste14
VRPTLVFVAGFAIGLWLHAVAPLHVVAGQTWILPAIGALTIAAGALLFIWALILFARARTGIMWDTPVRHVMTRGPYTWSRNPQYISFAAMYVGAALVMNTWWPIALLPAVVLAVSGGVILAEEQYMRASFGAEYDEYCRRVRRWL